MTTDPPPPLQLIRDGLDLGPLSPRTPSTPTALRGLNNPLTSKVTSVLSASYADSEFRESLALLDERGVKNNAETRRQLRLDVQKEVIRSNGDIIDEFGRVADQLRKIGATIEKLNKTYSEMKSQITTAHDATESVLEEATTLMEQRRQVETRHQLLKAFLGHFVLTDDEVASLTLTAEPVDDRFFSVLNKAKLISKDCEVLLGFEEDQTLGLEIMERTSKNINSAFQKLYRWVQREFKTLNLENPQIGSAMSRALRVLAERPTLFQSCLDSFAEARENILSDAFYTALTGNLAHSASGAENQHQPVKPIELAAHDPLRYVGDMLAWIHSAAVSEREALEALFVGDGGELARDIQAGRQNEVWRLASDEGDDENPAFDAVKALNELVDRDVSGATRILRQRVEQVIRSGEETILAYKLANLLNFYRLTFARLLGGGEKSVLVESLSTLESEALRHFRSLMRDHIATLRAEFHHRPSDLGPPDFLQEALKQLVAIMKTYDTSLSSSSSREADFQPILVEAFDPFIKGCESMAETVINPPDDSVFLINCFLVAKESLAGFDFTSGRVSQLQAEIDRRSGILTDSQYGFLCHESGLGDIFAALGPATADKELEAEKVRTLEALQPPALVKASQRLDDFLPSALMDAMEKIKQLQDSRLAREITEEAAERFCVEFERLEEALILADELSAEKDSGDDDWEGLRALFPRTTGEIRVLLS